MSLSLARLDLTQLFCDVDDVYRKFERLCEQAIPRLPCDGQPKAYQSRLSISDVMTIVIAFHGSGYRTFKDFYNQKVLPDWRDAFPNLVSYGRFIELMPWSFMALVSFLNTCCFGKVTGISFIDSTSVAVCHIKRAKTHKTFKGLAGWGKSSVGWYFGFKLHLIINDHGELLTVALTPGNTDDRKPVPDMTKDLVGKLFGDRGYISQALFESLFERGLELITKRRKTMKNALMPLLDKLLLRKRPIIETVNGNRPIAVFPSSAESSLLDSRFSPWLCQSDRYVEKLSRSQLRIDKLHIGSDRLSLDFCLDHRMALNLSSRRINLCR